MPQIFKKTDKKGYSLPEVIVAIAILGLLGAMFSQISFSSLKARDVSRERLTALAIATSAIDEVKAWRGEKDGPDEWVTIEKLKKFLANDAANDRPGMLGYYSHETDANSFLKTSTDSNEVDYEVELKIMPNNGVEDTFDLQITINSPNVRDWKIQTRIRGK